MTNVTAQILIVPGWQSSGPSHWQRLWERDHPEYTRVEQSNWDEPDLAEARSLLTALDEELLPHERADEQVLLPLVARALGSTDAVAALSRTHAEIEHQVARLHRLLAGIDDETAEGDVAAEDVVELRRLLYGLYAILRLHNAQEDEGAMSLTTV